jgi:hypothetical protein
MTKKKVWLRSAGAELEVTKTEPASVGLNVAVAVRAAEEAIPSDGVWLNGARSYGTDVMIDGQLRFHSAEESRAGRDFELHENAGGGSLL